MPDASTRPDPLEALLERIQKLLQFSQDHAPTEAELQNAAARVQQILTKHNLTMADVEAHSAQGKDPYIAQDFKLKGSKAGDYTWRRNLLSTLAHHDFCGAIWKRGQKWGAVIGQKRNIDVVTYLYTVVARQMEALCAETEKVQWRGMVGVLITMEDGSQMHWLSWRKGFYMGMVDGLDKILEARKWANNDEKALVAVKDSEVKEATQRFFPKATEHDLHQGLEKLAYEQGKAAAGQISLTEGVTSGCDQAALPGEEWSDEEEE